MQMAEPRASRPVTRFTKHPKVRRRRLKEADDRRVMRQEGLYRPGTRITPEMYAA